MAASRKKYSLRNRVALLRSGERYFEVLLRMIADARQEFHLQTYILEPDTTGRLVLEALIAAAARGVAVYIQLDAYGSGKLDETMLSDLRSKGIRIRKYGRLISRGKLHLGRRMHHKITVMDNHTALVGGINISDNYSGWNGKPPWLDYAVVVQGETARQLNRICRKRWKDPDPQHELPSRESDRLPFEGLSANDRVPVRITQNDFLRRKQETAASYRQAIRQARNSLVFVGGYFLPGGLARRLLKKAARRGVAISLIVSAESDVGVVRNSRRYLYGWLLRNGIRIFEYHPSNVHGKLLLKDNSFVSIGSYDLNNLSTYSNIELNLDIRDLEFSEIVRSELEAVVAGSCHEVTRTQHGQEGIFRKFVDWASYQLVKTLFILSVWLANRDDRDI
ncbi:MAG: phospholipase D-like domain-containing protein [Bacteroidia bacterium]|jgi:cardiolipin synthase